MKSLYKAIITIPPVRKIIDRIWNRDTMELQ